MRLFSDGLHAAGQSLAFYLLWAQLAILFPHNTQPS